MGSRIVIEPIAAEDALRESATAEDLAFVGQFSSASRRCEVLAWRAIVRRELGNDTTISHDEYGAPAVDKSNVSISVSHSRDRVAVQFADGACAVDIESEARDFGRVATRYLSSEEQQLAEQYNLYPEMWCAKEALYKYYKKGGLDFVRDVAIKEHKEGILCCSILDGEPIEVKVKRANGLVMAVID